LQQRHTPSPGKPRSPAGRTGPAAGFRWRLAADGEAAGIEYHDRRDRARLDTTRAAHDLGFAPAFGPEAALADYAQWVQAHRSYFLA
jgi:nucleoside-diphosphate-sugar epimerase